MDSITDSLNLDIELSRAKFEDLCKPIFMQSLAPLDLALRDAGLDKDEIDQIIMVGGTTRIPKIQSMLSQYFGGKKVNLTQNPDEVVALGATI